LNVPAAFRGQFEQASAYGLVATTIAEETQRNVEAKPDSFRRAARRFGVPHQAPVAAAEKRAPELSASVEDVLATLFQQDVGHGGADLRAGGNREQVGLRFCGAIRSDRCR
jgi:hypothetical protein